MRQEHPAPETSNQKPATSTRHGQPPRSSRKIEVVLVSINPQPPRPAWLRAPAPTGENYRELKHLIDDLKLHTVCESAACPNTGECWNRRTATFMILGNVCRSEERRVGKECRFRCSPAALK